ncbi:MAG: efflux RND transporter permease subunit [Sphaerochaeta sp.]|nr:efflux RND transporter permease subunit [Sphaerochaeta sp.]
MHTLISWVLRHTKIVLFLIFAGTLAALTMLPSLELNSEYINLLPPKEEHKLLKQEVLNVSGSNPGDLYCLLEGDTVFTAKTLNAVQQVLDELSSLEEVKKPLSPFAFITVQKKGTRLSTLPLSPVQEGNIWTEEDARVFKQRLQADEIAKGLLSTEDGDALLFQVALKEKRTDQAEVHRKIQDIVNSLSSYAEVSLIGTPLFEDRVLFYLSHDLNRLLILCMAVIVLLFYLAFRSKRAVIIPFSLSLSALVWTLACMVLLGYALTVVNIIVPSMVLILGSSYAIHVLSEYYRSLTADATKEDRNQQIITSVTKISKTIFGACLTTIVGFLSLLVCELEAFKELGIAVSLGIFFCALLSMLYIPALLSILPTPKRKDLRTFTHGPIARLVHALSLRSVRSWPLAIILFAALITSFTFTKQQVKIETDYLTYFPKNDQLIAQSIEFAQKIGGSDPHYITLTAPGNEKNYFLRPDVLQQVYAFEEELLRSNEDITHLLSFSRYVAFLHSVHQGSFAIPDTPGLLLTLSRLLVVVSKQMDHPILSSLISEDGSRITLTIRSFDSRYNSWESLESVQKLQQSIMEATHLLPDNLAIDDWGVGVDALRMSRSIAEDQNRSLLLSLVLVLLIVMIQFKSVKTGFFALVPTLTGIMGNYLFMYLLDIPFDVVTIIFASVTVGVGVDAALHFLLRFRRRQAEHPALPYEVVVAQTLEETGRPILLTSSALILGLLVLLFASFLPIRYFGLLLSFALLVTTFATLFILPSLMIALHKLSAKSRKRP